MKKQTFDSLKLSTRSQEKHAQILDAAQQLFLRDGFARTSMDAIREKAQVSKPTLYTHFESKENLFIGVIEHSLEDISDVWDEIASSSITITTKAGLRTVLLKFAQAGLEHLLSPRTIRLARTLLAEGSNFPELGREFRDRVPQRARGMISAVLASAQKQGVLQISAEEIPAAVQFFQAQLLSYLLLEGLLVFKQDPIHPSPEELETMVDLYIKMIC